MKTFFLIVIVLISLWIHAGIKRSAPAKMQELIEKPITADFLSEFNLRYPPLRSNRILPKAIAHAFGGIDGEVYTNSKEAFDFNYAKGCRFFEADMWVTPDAKVVFFHDGQEPNFGLKPGFTGPEFAASKFKGKYTPVTSELFVRMMTENPDWYLISDVKSFPNERALSLLCEELQKKGIDCRNRFFPQVYGVGSDYEEVSKLGFPSIILTLYRTSITEQDLFRFVHDHQNIAAITIPAGKWTKTLTDALRTLGVRTYVHTINGKKESDRFLNQGVHGVYTDYDCHSQEMSRI